MSFHAIPEITIILGKDKKKLKRIISLGTIISVTFYALFTLIVVGFMGINTPEVATLALGKVFVVLKTQWENIHPKQKMEKDKLEGKTDRTMGVGTLSGRKKKKKTEYVDVDVAYQIGKFFDHAYLLADGIAYSLDKTTEEIPEGINIQQPFTIPKKGDIHTVDFVYSVPKSAKNLSFQFFDYGFFTE